MRRYTFAVLCHEYKSPSQPESNTYGESLLLPQYQSIKSLKAQITELFQKLDTLSPPPLVPPEIPISNSQIVSPSSSSATISAEKRQAIDETVHTLKQYIQQYEENSSNFGNSVNEPNPGNTRLVQLVKLSVKHDLANYSLRLSQVQK